MGQLLLMGNSTQLGIQYRMLSSLWMCSQLDRPVVADYLRYSSTHVDNLDTLLIFHLRLCIAHLGKLSLHQCSS